jgi:predicted TPR repeat methyltransferase
MTSLFNGVAALEHVKTCPVCAKETFSKFVVSDGMTIVRCKCCGLLFTNPRVPEKVTRAFFEVEYLKDDKVVDENMTSFRLAPMRRVANIVKRLRPQGGHLLDIGTASGLLPAQFIQSPQWHVEGLEPSKNAAKKAAEQYHIQVHNGFIDTIDWAQRRFDVITVLDTFFLEPQPNRMLAKASALLTDGGFIVFEIPGLLFRLLKNTGPIARVFYGQWAQLNPKMQLFYYRRETLEHLLRNHGFDLVATYPEQSPIYGNPAVKIANHFYFTMTRFLYNMTAGRLHLTPKEVLVFRKVVQ